MRKSLGYNPKDKDSILKFAQQLIDKTIEVALENIEPSFSYEGKGSFGHSLQQNYFGIKNNSDSAPDFIHVGVELKSSSVIELKSGRFEAKERISLNIIDYYRIVEEEFEESHFLKKNSTLLIVFYLYQKLLPPEKLKVITSGYWELEKEDSELVKKDWEFIQSMVKKGLAHELSEGQTNYIGAATKAQNSSYVREQPYASETPKQRAFSLKRPYVSHILRRMTGDDNYGKLLHTSTDIKKTLEDVVESRFAKFIGLKDSEIANELGMKRNNPKQKNYYNALSKLILINSEDLEIEEFDKAGISTRSIRVTNDKKIIESVSYNSVPYEDIYESPWEESEFKSQLELKQLFIFYRGDERGNRVLEKAILYTLPSKHIEIASTVYMKVRNIIRSGEIVRGISKGRRSTNFPKLKDNLVAHFRPHARDANDTYSLPVRDKLTGLDRYTKYSFWLNNNYILRYIYKS